MAIFSEFVKGGLCMCGCFLIQFTLGTIFTFGNMSPYIASYLKYRTNNTWVTNGDMVWIFSIAIFSQSLTMSFGSFMERKIGPRITCLLGCSMMSTGVITTYFSIMESLWIVVVTYGLIVGLGTGMTNFVVFSTPMKWFPENKGLVCGIVVAGFGLGPLLFNFVQTFYINPSNYSPNSSSTVEKYFTNPEVLNNVPFCFLVIGISYAAIQMIGVMLINNPNYEIYSEIQDFQDTKLLKETNDNTGFTVIESIKNCRFWILWTTFFFNGIVIVAISSLYKTFGQTIIRDDRFLSLIGAVASIFSACGLLIWGFLFDIFYYKNVMTCLTVLLSIFTGTFYICTMIKSEMILKCFFGTWVCLLFFCIAGTLVIFPTATSKCFGSHNVAIISGIIFTGYALSTVLVAFIASYLLQVINYWGYFIIATICAIFNIILTQLFPSSYIDETPVMIY